MKIDSIGEMCTGCLACVHKCPSNCISVISDSLGNKFPEINYSKCIDCGVCYNVCQVVKQFSFNNPMQVYAAWNKDIEKCLTSSSGGIATLLSEYMINQGGVVYGCTFKTGFQVVHVRCSTLSEIYQLKGSKYVQSDMTTMYSQIQNDVKDERKILFIGTPCQVAGVKSVFKNYEELYTVDLICHGVPSLKLFIESLSEKILNRNIDNVVFRRSNVFKREFLELGNVAYAYPLKKDLYMKGFFTGLFYRKSCYQCKYARGQRISDVTLGDFWGIEKYLDTVDVSHGISCVLINSNKGKWLWEFIKNEINYMERNMSEAMLQNKQLSHPMRKTFRTVLFYKLFPILGFKYSCVICMFDRIIKSYIVK